MFDWLIWTPSGQTGESTHTVFSPATKRLKKKKATAQSRVLQSKVKVFIIRNNLSSFHLMLQSHTVRMTTDNCHK